MEKVCSVIRPSTRASVIGSMGGVSSSTMSYSVSAHGGRCYYRYRAGENGTAAGCLESEDLNQQR
jgi:hypothetical protein